MDDKRTRLFKAGKELFSTRGFKDTNVAGITARAGVSVGTFYNYYPSKEKLFAEIFLAENAKLKKRMLKSVDLDEAPLELIKKLVAFNLAGMQSNPILRQWYNPDVFARIERLFREENGIGAVGFLYDTFVELVKRWQTEGKMRSDIDPEMIMAIFAAIINVDMHKEEIGLEYFPALMDHLTEYVMRGLTGPA